MVLVFKRNSPGNSGGISSYRGFITPPFMAETTADTGQGFSRELFRAKAL
jgi:hypothetical protein